jgi:hypothetical protein
VGIIFECDTGISGRNLSDKVKRTVHYMALASICPAFVGKHMMTDTIFQLPPSYFEHL